MRDKVHIEEVKVRLTEDDKRKLLNLSRSCGITPAALARSFIKKFLETGKFQVASLQTGEFKGSPSQGLGASISGNQSGS